MQQQEQQCNKCRWEWKKNTTIKMVAPPKQKVGCTR